MYLVFDIGGTNTRIASSTDLMTLSDPIIFDTPESYEEGIQLIGAQAQALLQGHSLSAVAGGIREVLDKNKTKLLPPPHVSLIPDWTGKPLKQDLEDILGSPVYLENDAAMVGLGEASFGEALKYPLAKIVAYLTVSTGVGGARITNKRIDPTSLGFEPGHQIIVPDGLPCRCGGKGHLESYISGSALERIYKRTPSAIEDPTVWAEVTKYLAIGLNNTVVHWSPDIVILGGGIAERIDLDTLRSELKKYMTIFQTSPIIEKASLGDLGGLYGALVLLHKL